MSPHIPTGRGHLIAYGISAFSTLLWAGCVMPAGFLAEGIPVHHSSPMSREAWLLVPALLLLVVGPVGVVLSRTRRGLAAVLASTDAFVAIYMALVLTGWGAVQGAASGVLVGLLFGLGILSVIEVIRLLRTGPGMAFVVYIRGLRLALYLLSLLMLSWLLVQEWRDLASPLGTSTIVAIGAVGATIIAIGAVGAALVREVIRLLRTGPGPPAVVHLRGLRLALCLLALLTPSWILIQAGRDLASLLIPYAIIAIGAGGAAVARTETGLRLTTAILHLAFAIHIFVVLRFTIFERAEDGREAILSLRPFGWFTLGVSACVSFLALLQVVRLLRHVYFEASGKEPAPEVVVQA